MSRTPSLRTFAWVFCATVLAAVCAAGLGWGLTGGRWYVVATPSMGQAAPVGTLLLTRPVTLSQLHVGNIVTFHPPGFHELYSHRVVAITAGGIRTKGDINSTVDPWVLHQSNLVGKVTARWWALGWVLRGLPLLLTCLAVTGLLAACVAQRWRAPTWVVGTAVSVSVVAWVLHPWIGLTRLQTSTAHQGVMIRTVSTGVLPTVATAVHGGTSAALRDGQVGTVHVLHANRRGEYLVSGALDLTFWWWVAVILICLLPLLWCLIVGLPPVPEVTPELDQDTSGEPDGQQRTDESLALAAPSTTQDLP